MSGADRAAELFFNAYDLDRASAERVVRDALHGMDDGELFMEATRSEVLAWDDGRLKSASSDRGQGFGLRGICDETIGMAHGVDLSLDALRKASRTLAAVRGGYQGTMALPPCGTNAHHYADLNPIDCHAFDEKVRLLQEIDAYVRSKSQLVRQVSLSLSCNWQALHILRADCDGLTDIRPLYRLNVSVVLERDGRMETGSVGMGGRTDDASCFDAVRWKNMADEAMRKAMHNLDAVEAPAGEMQVVVGSGWPAVLLHEAVGHGLEGDFHRKKTSVFSGMIGQRVASPGVTIVDDGTLQDRRGSLTIDDEGTPTQCTTLIEDGILVGLMQDRLNARLMGQMATGNGRRESFSSQPYPRMTNTFMRSGGEDPRDIISSVKKGLYAADFGGGTVDITSGKFVFTATEAYEIENGKIGRPVKGASLVGSGHETLMKIKKIGNDSRLDSGIGSCGKNGQYVPVGVGQPTMLLDGVTVGGSSVG